MGIKEILRKARHSGYGVVSPLAFSIESLRSIIATSHEAQQPIIVRVEKEHLPLEEAIYWTKEYQAHYPLAVTPLFADGIKAYEEAVAACLLGADGVGLSDGIAVGTKDSDELLAAIGVAAKAAETAVQITVPFDRLGQWVAKSGMQKNVGIVKITGAGVTDENAEAKAKQLQELLQNEDVAYALEDTALGKVAFKVLRHAGIAKFDVYESLSHACMDKVEELVENDRAFSDRFYIFKLRAAAENVYFEGVKDRVYKVGQFILR